MKKKMDTPMENDDLEIRPCPSCMAPNLVAAAYCDNCNMPLSAYASLDPIGVISVEGHLLRKSISIKPKFVVVLGVWILFFPMFVLSFFGTITLALGGGGSREFIVLLISVFSMVLSLTFLYRVTKNFVLRDAVRNEEEN